MMRFVLDVYHVLNTSCEAHTELFSRAVDEPLRPGEVCGLRLHMLYCRGCRRFRRHLAQMRSLAAMLGRRAISDAGTGLGAGLPAAVRDRLMARLRREAANG